MNDLSAIARALEGKSPQEQAEIKAYLSSVNAKNSAASPQSFESMDQVIAARTPQALAEMQSGLLRHNAINTQGINQAVSTLNPLAGFEAETEINNLLGSNGYDSQVAAINGIKISDYDRELQRRQRATQDRMSYANGDVSGASLLNSMQLAGGQQQDNITTRINELSPLADMGRQARARQSSIYETGYMQNAAQTAASGVQRANVRLGGVAPLIQNNLQAANMRGLEGIGAANERGQIASSLAGAAGQWAGSRTQQPSIQAYSGFQDPYMNQSYYQPSDTASANYTQNMAGYV